MTCPFQKSALHIFGVFVIEHRHERTEEEGGADGARALRVREHDVRRAERPARQMRPCWEDSPCKGVVEPGTVAVLCKSSSSGERIKNLMHVER
jgi:hypothetical protein